MHAPSARRSYSRLLVALLVGVASLAVTVARSSAGDGCVGGSMDDGVCLLEVDHHGISAPDNSAATPAQLVCETDHSSFRIQVVYAWQDTDRFAQRSAAIHEAAAVNQRVYDITAQAQDASKARIPRFVSHRTTDGCKLDIVRVQIPHDTLKSPYATRKALEEKGLATDGMVYLVLAEGDPTCGKGLWTEDERKDPAVNAHNSPRVTWVAVVGRYCWDPAETGGTTIAHELGHVFGAVQPNAPNASSLRHCYDGHDVMCDTWEMSDDHEANHTEDACPQLEAAAMLDCGGDDYFNASGSPTGYLARNWNTADSYYLMRAPLDSTRVGATDPGRAPKPKPSPEPSPSPKPSPEPTPEPGGGSSPSATFDDVPRSHLFHDAIVELAESGITRGCNTDGTRFCPDDPVTRGQMAAFLDRALGLPDGSATFADSRGHLFQRNIAALADAGITRGCNPPSNTRFCPDDPVTRGQMAAFLDRALRLPDGSKVFDDTRGHVFQSNAAALYRSGITRGCNPPSNSRFCPDDYVTRGQMAAFLTRAGLTG